MRAVPCSPPSPLGLCSFRLQHFQRRPINQAAALMFYDHTITLSYTITHQSAAKAWDGDGKRSVTFPPESFLPRTTWLKPTAPGRYGRAGRPGKFRANCCFPSAPGNVLINSLARGGKGTRIREGKKTKSKPLFRTTSLAQLAVISYFALQLTFK